MNSSARDHSPEKMCSDRELMEHLNSLPEDFFDKLADKVIKRIDELREKNKRFSPASM